MLGYPQGVPLQVNCLGVHLVGTEDWDLIMDRSPLLKIYQKDRSKSITINSVKTQLEV
jgi:hypothetical protein